jgi:hypothetical protein
MNRYKASAIIGSNVLCHQIIEATSRLDAIKKIEEADGIIANILKDGGRLNIVKYNKINEWFDDNQEILPFIYVVGLGIVSGVAIVLLANHFNYSL